VDVLLLVERQRCFRVEMTSALVELQLIRECASEDFTSLIQLYALHGEELLHRH